MASNTNTPPPYAYVPATYDTSLDMSALFPQVNLTTDIDLLTDDGQQVFGLDFLSQGFQNLLNQIRNWSNYLYRGEKWTTLCYQFQGTTSLWLFNLAFNGLDTPMQLQVGMLVRFPNIQEVQRILSQAAGQPNTGNLVTLGAPNILNKFT
jgi:hypothetical protein